MSNMNLRKFSTIAAVGFCLLCGLLVIEAAGAGNRGNHSNRCILLQTTAGSGQSTDSEINTRPVENPVLQEDSLGFTDSLTAENAPLKTITLGSADRKSSFMFELKLSSRGAAIKAATLSKFNNRDYENPQPLRLLESVRYPDGSEILSMANNRIEFVNHGLLLRLNELSWQSSDVETSADGSQKASFVAVIKTVAGMDVLKLTKTYSVAPGKYHLQSGLVVENLSDDEQKINFGLTGPMGLGKEGIRADMRKAVAGFRNAEGRLTSTRIDAKKLRKAKTVNEQQLQKQGDNFLWAAAVNKYFASILVPLASEGEDYCDWVAQKTGRFYNPDRIEESGDETIGVNLKSSVQTLSPLNQPGSIKKYNFLLYLGPKDKSLFDKSELYQQLGFVQTIDFMACCCPASIINPMAFGILASMRWMYGFIGNYGIVIIILVFLIRLIIHPLTKKSQVSMSKFSKLAPKIEQIKKNYANNKTEMNKQMMSLYKEQGASPIMGFLPMLVQMPVWIALYSAIYSSIELRGAAFLPFWITDLSAPDALIRFSAVHLPLFGKLDSLNLLPLLMGVAFYLQQKLMPSQAAASAANPQIAQQQKMMMFMMPIMFPLFLYKAPSGLNLYIMSSVSAGVIEQYVIRKHIREKEQAESQGLVSVTSKTGGKVKKKKPKPFYRYMI